MTLKAAVFCRLLHATEKSSTISPDTGRGRAFMGVVGMMNTSTFWSAEEYEWRSLDAKSRAPA